MRDTETSHMTKSVADFARKLGPEKLLAIVAVTALLAGCSSVPDAVNPVEWYKGVRDAITGDEKAPEENTSVSQEKQDEAPNNLVTDRNKPAPGANEEFPKLSSVPERPKTSSAEEREEVKEGLIADREGAKRYSSDVIRRQGEASNPLAPAPKPVAKVATQPAPKPMVKPAMTPAPELPPPPQPMSNNMPDRTPSGQLLAVMSPQPKVSIPRVNPNPPQLGIVPGYESVTRGSQEATVVISGAGTQTYPGLRERIVRSPRRSATSNLPGVKSLSEFNPAQVNGSYQVATIIFGNGSAKVRSRARKVLRQVIAQYKKTGGTIRVVGHASHRTQLLDIVRHKMANFKVSVARADAVAKELVRLGARSNNLYVGAVSDFQPKYREHMPTGEAGNRRTDIYIDF